MLKKRFLKTDCVVVIGGVVFFLIFKKMTDPRSFFVTVFCALSLPFACVTHTHTEREKEMFKNIFKVVKKFVLKLLGFLYEG